MSERADGRPPFEHPPESETLEAQETGAANVDVVETAPALETEQSGERVREAGEKAHRAAASGDSRWGDWSGTVVRDGQLILSPEEQHELETVTAGFRAEAKASKLAVDKGYKVAGAYDIQVQGWTTRTKVVEVGGKRLFVLYSFPSGATRRRFDRLMETISGDPLHKPTVASWKRTVESRSEIPTVAGTRPDMVVMPYLESFNAYDLFAHQKDVTDFGPFEWAREAGVGDKLALIGPIGEALAKLHASGKRWGEAILPNVILDQNKKPTFVDPETVYEGIPEGEQRARDVRTLITSISGALSRGDGYDDVQAVANLVLEGYGGDEQFIEVLDGLCAKKQPFLQKMTFEFWGKFRVGASDGKHFEQVRLAIRAALAERREE